MTLSAEPQEPSPRSRRSRNKRALILDVAVEVFADKGYHGTRVSDIAREAGIAYGLVYHYFKSKEEILDTIYKEQWGGFLTAVDAIVEAPGSIENKLLSIAALILNAYRVRESWVKVLVFEIQRSSRFAQPEKIRAVGDLFRTVAGVLREGQASGEFKPELDPDIACLAFIGALDSVVTSRVLNVIEIDGGPAAEKAYNLKVARTVVEIFLSGLRLSPSNAPDPSSGERNADGDAR